MTEEQFWKLIGDSKAAASGDLDAQGENLLQALSKLSDDELVDFDRTLTEFQFKAYGWDLWGAAYLINGGCSDDGFDYFINWLIAQGEQVYKDALENPDSLASVVTPDEEAEFEELSYFASEVWEESHDDDLPDHGLRRPGEPSGEDWDFDDDKKMAERFPRLWEKFGEG